MYNRCIISKNIKKELKNPIQEPDLEHIKEFSRYAFSYESHNLIQREVAKKLVNMIDNQPQNILDLGCGSGAIYKNLPFTCKNFVGVDSAKGMCELHPKGTHISIINESFESSKLYEELRLKNNFDLIISSSALQWSKDLNSLMKLCKDTSENILFSLFTANTFKSIYKLTNLQSFLPSSEEIIKTVQTYYDIEYHVEAYKLFFEDNLSKFRYIKKSGVSGGKRQLNLSQTKKLIKNYPLEYLEFEVIYIKSK